MKIQLLAAAAMLAGVVAAPAFAQSNDAMMSKDHMMSSHMSMSQKHMMTKCNAMSHDMMMKNHGCMKMMKMHPDMMKAG